MKPPVYAGSARMSSALTTVLSGVPGGTIMCTSASGMGAVSLARTLYQPIPASAWL